MLIEGHCRFSAPTAVKIGERLATFDPPGSRSRSPHQQIDALVEVARAARRSDRHGREPHRAHQFAELLSHNAVHILQPEPHQPAAASGGAEGLRDGRRASTASSRRTTRRGRSATAVCLQLGACTPELLRPGDLRRVQRRLGAARSSTTRSRSVDGYIRSRSGPGLGIELNLDECDKHPYQAQNFLPLFAPGWERREGEASTAPASAAAVPAADQTARPT